LLDAKHDEADVPMIDMGRPLSAHVCTVPACVMSTQAQVPSTHVACIPDPPHSLHGTLVKASATLSSRLETAHIPPRQSLDEVHFPGGVDDAAPQLHRFRYVLQPNDESGQDAQDDSCASFS
jgi:hypothetical protein